MMKIKLPVFAIFIFAYSLLFAQELPVYQQYLLNPNLINPAMTGYEDCTSFLVTDRHQWLGIKGAPGTQTIGMQTRILPGSGKIHGVGINMYYDRNGAFRKSGGDLLYAYHFNISRRKDLVIGLGLLLSVYQNSIDDTEFAGANDPLIGSGINRSLNPDAGAGIFLYGNKFFAGLSASGLISNSDALQETESHFYLYTGLSIENRESPFKFEPSLLLKFTGSLKSQIDINLKTLLYDKYWYTLSFRNNLSSSAIKGASLLSVFGVTVNKFSFAYVFDLGLTSIQLTGYGSHEFMITYKICHPDRYNIDCPTYKGLIKRYKTR
jgi:type IX secretion system PorP/SprF family membrane protein